MTHSSFQYSAVQSVPLARLQLPNVRDLGRDSNFATRGPSKNLFSHLLRENRLKGSVLKLDAAALGKRSPESPRPRLHARMWGQHGQQRQQNLSWGGALGGNSGAGGAGLGIGALGPFAAFAHPATLPVRATLREGVFHSS